MSLSSPTQLAIQEHAKVQFPALVTLRRELHQHPELSGGEEWTAHTLAKHLNRLGWDVQTGVGGHGLVANWVTNPARPTIALRVDMDALPIEEVNAVPYRSQVPGVMHACGHDVHSTVGVGVAAVIASLGEQIPGNVRLLFQPEEEEITGALRMIRAGALAHPKPAAIFGLHVAPLPAGQVAWTDGLFLAGFEHLLISLHPESGFRGGRSHLNAVSERCCQVIRGFNQYQLPNTWLEMQAFWQLMQDPPGDLKRFIIYDATRDSENPAAWPGQFGIGIKAADHHLRRAALGRVRAAINTITAVTHTGYQIEPMGAMRDMRNDAGLIRAVLPDLQAVLGPDLVELGAAFPFNCEDFAYYTKQLPGAMVWLGGAAPGRGKYAMLHTPNFDVDERCLLTGTVAMTTLLLAALNSDPN
ncbi:MAG: amidohydrolase [Chloroflexota bacterium]|nr:amidohydrolase [Chloroflexota bacterium]